MSIGQAQRIFTRPNNGGIGAEVVGVDLSCLEDEVFEQLKQVYDANPVTVIRDQRLTPDEQVSFSRRFGQLEIHVLKQFLLPQHPEILVISNVIDDAGRPIGLSDGGRVCVWHTDMSYLEKPSRGSTLYALEVPMRDGKALGDTLFADTVKAYDALPSLMKARLEGLRAVHRMTKGYDGDKKPSGSGLVYSAEQRVNNPERAHPIVRTHPQSGRKCLYLNKLCCVSIEGLPDDEGEGLLEELYEHCAQPQFVYRHGWRKGDLVMWDNCTAQHLATMDYEPPLRRVMHRTTLAGTAPY
jgi:taurine dioxygenase